jgi:tetratricopeptide (TPR) repeat protein
MAKKSRRHKTQVRHTAGALTPMATPIASTPHKQWQIAVVCFALALATVFAYHGVLANDFVSMDDYGYVVENGHVHHGLTLQSISWAFSSFYASNWHPLTWITHMTDWSLYGRNPAGHHITNVLIHIINAILLFLLLLYLTGFIGRSAMVAFLFALHPAHVESVAWISERKDVLCVLFWLAALFAYAWYAREPSRRRFVWVVCAFACALLSKPMAVTLPFTLLLLDMWPLRRITFSPMTSALWFSSLWKLCVEKWLLFIMTAISCVITFLAQRAGGAVVELHSLSLWERIMNAAISYGRYLRITLWPNPLRVFYFHETDSISLLTVALSFLALILVTAICWNLRKERPYCLFGWLWFLGTLAPVIGIVQVGEQAMAERYTYLPLIGLFIAIVWLISDAVAKSPKLRVVTRIIAVALIVACAVKTSAQVKVWKDSVTLLTHTLAIDPRGEIPNLALGTAYMRLERYADAQTYFDRALAYNPSGPQALAYSAFCMIQSHNQHNMPLAGQRLGEALRIAPDDLDVLTVMALWSNLMGRPQDGEAYSRKVIATHPDSIPAQEARLYLADALQAENKFDQAAEEIRQLLAGDPDNYVAHNESGIILARQGLTQEALNEFRLSLAIQPNQPLVHYKIGSILMVRTHQFPAAVDEFEQAVKLDPANAHAHNDLGVALSQLGDYEKAVAQFNDAIQIDPTYADARRNLDLAQARMKTN